MINKSVYGEKKIDHIYWRGDFISNEHRTLTRISFEKKKKRATIYCIVAVRDYQTTSQTKKGENRIIRPFEVTLLDRWSLCLKRKFIKKP